MSGGNRTMRTLKAALAAAVLIGSTGGCQQAIYTQDGMKIRRGLAADQVAWKYGPPEAVCEQLGESRRYMPYSETTNFHADREDGRIYLYYPSRGYKLVVVKGKVDGSEAISEEEMEAIIGLQGDGAMSKNGSR